MGRGVDNNYKPTASSAGLRRRGAVNLDPEAAEEKRLAFLDQSKSGIVRGLVENEDLRPSAKTKHRPGTGRVFTLGQSRISKIVTGGQSGVDRGSLQFARQHGVSVGGWCPKGGWAEDLQTAPGVIALFPEMKETNSQEVEQRTQWNVRDSDATVIFLADNASSGSNLTVDTAKALNLPHHVFSLETCDGEEVRRWLESLEDIEVLNIAGPRESEAPGAGQRIQEILEQVFLK